VTRSIDVIIALFMFYSCHIFYVFTVFYFVNATFLIKKTLIENSIKKFEELS